MVDSFCFILIDANFHAFVSIFSPIHDAPLQPQLLLCSGADQFVPSHFQFSSIFCPSLLIFPCCSAAAAAAAALYSEILDQTASLIRLFSDCYSRISVSPADKWYLFSPLSPCSSPSLSLSPDSQLRLFIANNNKQRQRRRIQVRSLSVENMSA